MIILVTGGAGCNGADSAPDGLAKHDEQAISIDKLTYTGNLANLPSLDGDRQHSFIRGDFSDSRRLTELMTKYQPRTILNFAAEPHVDRSTHGPEEFIQTNIVGTFRLLESARAYHVALHGLTGPAFRFFHIDTDEAYDSLKPGDPALTERHRYNPNTPYSASKAAPAHVVRAYHRTYALQALTTNCSNNYAPYYFPEKLIPWVIHNALTAKPLPIYSDGQQIWDWVYVQGGSVIRRTQEAGRPDQTYNIGGRSEKVNLDVVHVPFAPLNELKPIEIGLSATSSAGICNDTEDTRGQHRPYRYPRPAWHCRTGDTIQTRPRQIATRAVCEHLNGAPQTAQQATLRRQKTAIHSANTRSAKTSSSLGIRHSPASRKAGHLQTTAACV